jgi:hypothetical protein
MIQRDTAGASAPRSQASAEIAAPMPLADWEAKVKPHLDFIGAGSKMAARHARMLPCRAEFETWAEGELAATRQVLEEALQNIIAAQSIYASKPLETDRAA